MNIRTSPTLPVDYGRKVSQHRRLAEVMRETDEWVHVGDYATRKTAASVASSVRSGQHRAYAGRRYEAEVITTKAGAHQVWGRYAGERKRTR